MESWVSSLPTKLNVELEHSCAERFALYVTLHYGGLERVETSLYLVIANG